MLIIIKLNHLKDSKVSIKFTKPNAEKRHIKRGILFIKYHLASQQNIQDPEF